MNLNNRYLQIAVLVVLTGAALFLIPRKQHPATTVTNFAECQQAGGSIYDGEPVTCVMPDGSTFEEQETIEPEVVVDTPQYGDTVTSPLTVTGKAKGPWYFEANLPVTLKDANGNVLVKQGMQAQSDWMTTDYVPFTGTLTFPTPTTQYGVLLIEKDNPSGDPQYDASFAVPVAFW